MYTLGNLHSMLLANFQVLSFSRDGEVGQFDTPYVGHCHWNLRFLINYNFLRHRHLEGRLYFASWILYHRSDGTEHDSLVKLDWARPVAKRERKSAGKLETNNIVLFQHFKLVDIDVDVELVSY